MSIPEPSFTLGIEEEYLLVDRTTRDLAREVPPDLMSECEAALPKQVSPEFLQCQIEIGTRVCDGLAMARAELAYLRSTVAGVAAKYDLAPIAASTHPFANWTDQQHTRRERYDALANDMRDVVQRMVICGMHVHVAVEHEDLRIDLFNQLPYFLPHLLALTTSSPFWRGRRTGLKSYRLAVFDEMPRTGLPEPFGSFGEYERTLASLVDAGLIEDATKIWWDLRPSARFPTIEVRIADVCTYLDDAIAVAALFICLTRMLYRLRRNNQRWRSYSRFLINENRWRAQRYGTEQGLVDFGRGEVVPYADLLEELIDLVREDAEHFGCTAEIAHARVILERGTSADRQIRRYDEAIAGGATTEDALKAVVDGLIEETLVGTSWPAPVLALPWRMIRNLTAALVAWLALLTVARAQDVVDVTLVLAVDVSWSMDSDEKQVQRDGYVAAFRDPDVIQAIREGGWGAIAVTYVEWAGTGLGQVLVPWRRIADAASANAFADELAAAPIGRLTRTSISSAMEISRRLLDESPFKGIRRVVDISGDGPNNQGAPVDETRDALVRQGITINGLPVIFKRNNPSGFPSIENLDVYYEDCVIGGTGSFLVTVTESSQFAAAIRRKLLLEIAAAEPQVIPAQAETVTAGSDCLIGEKMWQIWQQRIDWQ